MSDAIKHAADHFIFAHGVGRLELGALRTSEGSGTVRPGDIDQRSLVNNGPRVRWKESSKY